MKKCLMICFSLLISAFFAGEPVGCWLFNEGEGQEAQDTAGKFHAGLLRVGQNTRWVSGRNGYGVYFGGDSSVRNTSGGASIKLPAVNFTKPFTVEIWLKLDGDAPMRKYKDIIGNGSDRGPGFRVTSFYNSIQLRSGDGGKAVAVATNSATTVIPSGSWFQLVVTYDGNVGRIYINGEEKVAGEISLTQGKSDLLTVGSYLRGVTYPMLGVCDELKIYNHILSRKEIIQNYLKGIL